MYLLKLENQSIKRRKYPNPWKWICLIFLHFHSYSYAQQEVKLKNLSYTNKSVYEIVLDLQTKSKVDISFTDKLGLKEKNIRSFKVKDESLTAILHRLLSPYAIRTERSHSGYILLKDDRTSTQKAIEGRVTTEDGKALSGATVALLSNGQMSITDAAGKFSLLSNDRKDSIKVSFLGYEHKSVSVGSNQEFMEIVLKVSALNNLDEIVIVGYGVQRKVNVTGAVSVVDGKRLQDRPVSNVAQSLYGTVSGLTISYGNNGFEPGAAPSVQVRGQGSPYVLIDGTVGELSSLDPNNIESISILKDAAASAIYGARAPYGVLLVTTKSGKVDQKPQIDFSINAGPTSIINKPKMVDSYTFTRAINEMHDNQGVARLFAESTIDRIIAYIDNPTLPETVPDASNPKKWSVYQLSNGNNDWIDIHFGSGRRLQENIGISGGAKNINYYLSGGHSYEKGPLKMVDDTYNRYNFTAKIDGSVTNWLKIGSNTRLVHGLRERPIYNGEGGYGMIIHQIFRTHPEVYLKSPNGYYSQLSRVPQMRAGYDKLVDNFIMQRFSTSINPLKNWSINADYSINYAVNNNEGVNLVAYEDEVDGTLVPISLTVPSYIEKEKYNETYKSLNIFTSYKWNIAGSHQFDALLGYQQEVNKYDYLRGLKREIITPNIPSISTSTGEMQVYDNLTHWATRGLFARLNYNYADKYLFESNIRKDGTSKFAKGKREDYFPSFSAGWNASNEVFWTAIQPYINHLKLKASWGKLGNQSVDAYQDLALLGVSTNLPWIINGVRPAYVNAPNLVNTELTWESSKTTNFAVEMGFLENRLQLEFDYYQRLTYDRLGPAQALPSVIGAAIPKQNNSELRTKGWDLAVSWKGRIGDDFKYTASANMFDYLNIVEKYPNPTGILTTDYKGMRTGDIWGYETVGLIQTQERADQINTLQSQKFINGQLWKTGDVEYKDINGDGVINKGANTLSDHGDLKIIGNSTRRYQFGLNLSAAYKSFDVSMFLQGIAKRDLWLSGNLFWGFNQWNQSSLFDEHLDYYRDKEEETYTGLGMNTVAYFPRPYSNATQYAKNQQIQTRYLQDGAYLRLKNLQVGYTLQGKTAAAMKLRRARIYFSGENIYTGSKLPVAFDPETATLGELGNGKNMFSQATWSFGLNISY